MDESCWSPLNLSIPYSNHFLKAYLESKTLTEKEISDDEDRTREDDEYGESMEVISLACGLVGGDTLLPYLPASISTFLAITPLPDNNKYMFQVLRFLEELLGKLPMVHIEDACEAHIFCMEHPYMCGRYLCASSYVQSSEIEECCGRMYPEFHIKHEDIGVPKRDIRWGGTKLIDKGFAYKYDLKMTLVDSIKAAKRLALQPSH